jgi:hypothetical protein
MAVAETESRPETVKRPPRYCALPPQPSPQLAPDLAPDRAAAILVGRTKWVNGTVLHYYFFDDGAGEDEWVGADQQAQVVRQSFEAWKELGIGLEFQEVADRSEAEVRIGFMDGDGSWSYIGRAVLDQSSNQRTMNFGWDLTSPHGRATALHEIGHTFGFAHEHQNPFAGIVWDEERVYTNLGGPPNNWDREKTFHNVLRKLSPGEVEGSDWDPDSIMEYEFDAGLILQPERYRSGIVPPGTISEDDQEWVRKWYPGTPTAETRTLEPFESVPLSLKPQQQADFLITPDATRVYQIGTFGTADTVLVLFEEVNGQPRYLAGDDDSGTDRNAQLSQKLFQCRRYIARVRLYWAGYSGTTAVMYW